MYRILTKREKIILYCTVGVVLLSIIFNFFLSPIIAKNENLNKEINFTKTKLKKYVRLLSQRDAIQSKYAKFANTLSSAGEQKDALVSALSELENLAKNANIRIIDLRPQQQAKTLDLYQEILINLRTEGAMEGYLEFIYNLENSLSLLRIKKFQLTAKPNTQTLEGSFSISQISVLE